jgi:general secretion pathway protein D
LLGGLISGNNSTGNAGIPLLKEIPLLGALFGKETDKNMKTELVVLITPHIMNDESDVQAVTESFRALMPWLRSGDGNKAKEKDSP